MCSKGLFEGMLVSLNKGNAVMLYPEGGAPVELRKEEGRFVCRSAGLTIYFPGFGEMARYVTNTYPGLGRDSQ